jgi:hypothetical protein
MQRQVRLLIMFAALAATACTKDKDSGAGGAAPATPAASNREERPEYLVELLPPDAADAGTDVTALVHVAGRGHFHVNADYPLAFTPDAVDGLRFKDKRIALSDSAERTPCAESAKDTCEVRAKVPLTADKSAKLSGVLAFSICEPEQCLIKKAHLVVDVPVR